MNVRWTASAQLDRLDTMDYIAAENSRAALRMDQLLSDTAASLAEFAMRGSARVSPRNPQLFPHEAYRLVYEMDRDTVWILALLHTSRQWPPLRT